MSNQLTGSLIRDLDVYVPTFIGNVSAPRPAMKAKVFTLQSHPTPGGQKSVPVLSLTVVHREKGLGWTHLFGLMPAAPTEH